MAVRRTLAVVVMASALVVGACGDEPTDGEPEGAVDDEVQPCADLYVEGEVVSVEQFRAGCVLDDGSLLIANGVECEDGRTLVTFEDSSPQLWGFAGEPLRAAAGEGENASDPDYGEAFGTC